MTSFCLAERENLKLQGQSYSEGSGSGEVGEGWGEMSHGSLKTA